MRSTWLVGGLLVTHLVIGTSCEESARRPGAPLDGAIASDHQQQPPGDAGGLEPGAAAPSDAALSSEAATPEVDVAVPDHAGPEVDAAGTKLPDLVVVDFGWSPTAPADGQALAFSVTIKNAGTGATPAGVIHGVSFWIDGAVVTWTDSHVLSMPPGASVKLTANGGPSGSAAWKAQAGTHTVVAFADEVDRIAESNDSNNKLQKTITVSPSLAPDAGPPPADSGPPLAYDLIVYPGDIVKNPAGATVHTGSDAIQWALNNGKTVRVAAGKYQVSGELFLGSGNSLMGDGSGSTTLSFTKGSINMADVSNTTVKGFHVTGAAGLVSVASNGATQRNHLWEDIFMDHNDEGTYPFAVLIYLNSAVLDGIVYRKVIVDSPRMWGFMNNSDNSPNAWIKNILYEDCQALRCGVDAPDHYAHGNSFVWIPGFDLAERANVDHMTLINCRADYNWESGFHFENDPAHTNVIFKSCTANSNGQKPAGFDNKDGFSIGPLYGAGFFMGAYSKRGNISGLSNSCTGTGNVKGLIAYDMGV